MRRCDQNYQHWNSSKNHCSHFAKTCSQVSKLYWEMMQTSSHTGTHTHHICNLLYIKLHMKWNFSTIFCKLTYIKIYTKGMSNVLFLNSKEITSIEPWGFEGEEMNSCKQTSVCWLDKPIWSHNLNGIK